MWPMLKSVTETLQRPESVRCWPETLSSRSAGSDFRNGNAAPLTSGEAVVSLSATSTGDGYWLFTNDGRAFAYGDAARVIESDALVYAITELLIRRRNRLWSSAGQARRSRRPLLPDYPQ